MRKKSSSCRSAQPVMSRSCTLLVESLRRSGVRSLEVVPELGGEIELGTTTTAGPSCETSSASENAASTSAGASSAARSGSESAVRAASGTGRTKTRPTAVLKRLPRARRRRKAGVASPDAREWRKRDERVESACGKADLRRSAAEGGRRGRARNAQKKAERPNAERTIERAAARRCEEKARERRS